MDFEEEIILLEPDSKGDNIAVLISHKSPVKTDIAVMYIHGYTDYFFQEHLAKWYIENGIDFYALELRKYGRSILPHQRSNHIREIKDYDQEIGESISRIKTRDKHRILLVNGHSTGGLVACMYANFGLEKHRIDGLFLNSPFFEFNIPEWQLKFIPRIAKIGHIFPEWIAPLKRNGIYSQSIHKDDWGRWNFSKKLKPVLGFRMYFGWFRAIYEAQQLIQNHSDIQCPILVMHSDKTSFKKKKDPEIFESDVVLNVEHIKKYALKLGEFVTIIEIPRATHDVFLSKDEVQEYAFIQLKKMAGGNLISLVKFDKPKDEPEFPKLILGDICMHFPLFQYHINFFNVRHPFLMRGRLSSSSKSSDNCDENFIILIYG